MTEIKRFDCQEKYITLNNGVFAIAKSKNDAELISKTLKQLYNENEQLRKDNGRLRMKIESLNENFNRLHKLFNEVEDVDEDLMMEYIRIVGRTIDE